MESASPDGSALDEPTDKPAVGAGHSSRTPAALKDMRKSKVGAFAVLNSRCDCYLSPHVGPKLPLIGLLPLGTDAPQPGRLGGEITVIATCWRRCSAASAAPSPRLPTSVSATHCCVCQAGLQASSTAMCRSITGTTSVSMCLFITASRFSCRRARRHWREQDRARHAR